MTPVLIDRPWDVFRTLPVVNPADLDIFHIWKGISFLLSWTFLLSDQHCIYFEQDPPTLTVRDSLIDMSSDQPQLVLFSGAIWRCVHVNCVDCSVLGLSWKLWCSWSSVLRLPLSFTLVCLFSVNRIHSTIVEVGPGRGSPCSSVVFAFPRVPLDSCNVFSRWREENGNFTDPSNVPVMLIYCPLSFPCV